MDKLTESLLRENLRISRFDTDLGEMIACADDSALIFLHWADAENKFADSLLARADAMREGENAVLTTLRAELSAYFHGLSAEFRTPLYMRPHSAFRQKIWQGLRAIPLAQTRSYGEETAAAGFARSYTRAAANAIGQNPFLLLVPCHRVIGADGSLTGYHGGLPRKQALLAHEKRFFSGQA